MEEQRPGLALNLHDCLSLGEFELGLAQPAESGEAGAGGPSDAEVAHRLPLLLRVLDKSRPLAAVPRIGGGLLCNGTDVQDDGDGSNEDGGNDDEDPVLQRCVDRLEDRAAGCASAEGVEVVACRLAPMACRRLSRLKANDDLDALEVLARYPTNAAALHHVGGGSKKRRKASDGAAVAAEPNAVEDIQGKSDDDDDGDNDAEDPLPTVEGAPRKRSQRQVSTDRDSSLLAKEEDSQEATVVKTMSELTLLVVQWRKDEAAAAAPTGPDATGDEGSRRHSTHLGISMEDSILAEERSGGAGGAGATACDLPSTVASLLHHLPALRHCDVAAALCRASLPQTPSLIARLGANAPVAVPALIRGCLRALHGRDASTVPAPDDDHDGGGGDKSAHVAAASAVRKSLAALAGLSPREAARVTAALLSEPQLVDLHLELALKHGGPEEAACLLLEQLTDRHSGDSHPDASRSDDGHLSPGAAHQVAHLEEFLRTNPILLQTTLQTLCADLRQIREGARGRQPLGRLSLVASAMAWTLYLVPVQRLLEQNCSQGFTDCLRELLAWTAHLSTPLTQEPERDDRSTCPVESFLDRPLAVMLGACCAALVTTCRTEHDRVPTWKEECLEGLAHLLHRKSSSLRVKALWARFLLCVGRNDLSGLLEGVLRDENVAPCHNMPDDPQRSRACVEASRIISACFKEHVEAMCSELDLEAFVFDPTTGLDLLRDNNLPEGKRVGRIKALLRHVLDSPSIASTMIRHPSLPNFIEEATALLRLHEDPFVPIVLPIQMELLGRSEGLRRIGPLSNDDARFLVCLMYCFTVREMEGLQSPFVVDFRLLPILETRCLCESQLRFGSVSEFFLRLASYIDRFCPEVRCRSEARITGSGRWLSESQQLSTKQRKSELFGALRKTIEGSPCDPDGFEAERAFLIAKEFLPESELVTTTVSALLSEPHIPPRVFSFPGLYREPLVVLKCSNRHWLRKGLRRVLISSLVTLLATNDHIAKDLAPTEEVRRELLDSRNEVVLRSLVHLLCNTSPGSLNCSLTLSVIRKMIVQDRGLLAVLFKQGLIEHSVDWIIEFVPECIEDASALYYVLSEWNTLGAPDRLVLADSSLRLAIRHGDARADELTRSLVYTALSQLISSFLLVLGPVGVPVSTLMGTGLDATSISRKAAFRMIAALSKVQSFRSDLRNECIAAIQKLLGACKGENIVSGLSGVLASRQKSLVKELMDSLMQANNAIGGGAQV